MKTIATPILVLLFLLSYSAAWGQDSFSIGLGQDSYFGFYANAKGSMPLKNSTADFVVYANYWTNPAFGNPTTGNDFWLESGLGLAFEATPNLILQPTLGLTFGKVLSGANSTVIGDGIVPSLALDYENDYWEAEGLITYYKSLRNEGAVTIDYLLYWAWTGGKLSPNFSCGAHYEAFIKTRETAAEREELYRWVGAYFNLIFKEKYNFRLTLGGEILDQTEATEFYKISVLIPLE